MRAKGQECILSLGKREIGGVHLAKKKTVDIVHRRTGEVLLKGARWCDSYFCKLRGFQFRRSREPGETLILVYHMDQSITIHMFFVFFPLALVWVDSRGIVTHAQLAKPWRPYYSSPDLSRYVIETAPEFLTQIEVGDEVDFV
jgi:uncharacterized membrane protein (UPF0127 family)